MVNNASVGNSNHIRYYKQSIPFCILKKKLFWIASVHHIAAKHLICLGLLGIILAVKSQFLTIVLYCICWIVESSSFTYTWLCVLFRSSQHFYLRFKVHRCSCCWRKRQLQKGNIDLQVYHNICNTDCVIRAIRCRSFELSKMVLCRLSLTKS